MPKPKLISFNLCPFVQRSVITMKVKKIDCDVTYIDLANKPEWFLKISPFGKVPVVQIGEDVLFESAVINEYLDETTPPSLHPSTAIEKAKNRAWIEFGSGLIMSMFQWSIAENLERYDKTYQAYLDNLKKLEDQLGDGPYFNGDAFSLVDAAYAPLWQRQAILDDALTGNVLSQFPKIQKWSSHLLQMPEVTQSVIPHFKDVFLAYIRAKDGIMAHHLSAVTA